MTPISDLAELLRAMQPFLNPGIYVYAMAPADASIDAAHVIASIREPAGLSLIIEESLATKLGLEPALRCAWITLRVQSDLQATGFTAAFSTALGRAGIACNVVAGLAHDHIFVPIEQAEQAMRALTALQQCGPD
ncbi:ACT domain-containing protein [Dokdonella immobilis]|uniref:ACT domain-containing protein n=1 Tax=Dokdonella immobilis TaxID=578942 RepID=UPI000B864CB4|nr:ACT domain-containing protein [Dokdonella immobilis]